MKVYFAPQSRAVRTVWLLEEIGKDSLQNRGVSSMTTRQLFLFAPDRGHPAPTRALRWKARWWLALAEALAFAVFVLVLIRAYNLL